MWPWSSSSSSSPSAGDAPKTSSCPVKHEQQQKPSCPVQHSSDSLPQMQPPSSCPAHKSSEEPSSSSSSSPPSGWSKLNPLNYMFSNISQSPSPNQSVPLSVERENSTIPRPASADDSGPQTWEYPSPQQMYNALLRKGFTDTPADAVESMVAVHNFLNEGAWQEITLWERTFGKGLIEGWKKCRRGEENLVAQLEREQTQHDDTNTETPRLVRFMGRPREMTPKASTLLALGWLMPSRFGTEPPFDRHDWYVSRDTPRGPREVRYVIDYYSAPPEPSGEPVFYLDIRPALDSPSALLERLARWGGDTWWRASGGQAREQER